MSRQRASLITLVTLLLALIPMASVDASHCPGLEDRFCHSTPAPNNPDPTAPPSTPQPTAPPPPPSAPDPTQAPAPNPDPAPRRTSSPTRNTTTTRSSPAPDTNGTPEPTPLDLEFEFEDPSATPEILVQGPVLDDGGSDDEQALEARQAQNPEGSSGWAFFLVGFIIGGAIGWVGRGVRAMRRRKRQQLFG